MIKEHLTEVKERIEQACIRSGRNPGEVTLIAVSKTKPVPMLEEAYAAGARDFGENKVQEIAAKKPELPEDIRWHMIGHLQRNKVHQVIGKAVLIHAVDSLRLAEQIEQEAAKRNLDVDVLYEVPLVMEKEHLAQSACECLDLPCPEPDLAGWQDMIDAWKHPVTEVTVALVGKYIQLHDAYISVVEALKHGGVANHAKVNIKWVDSEHVTEANAPQVFHDVKGILVPGGFGDRGIDGKIYAIQYAREHGIPFLGLCLGMQLSIVEFSRNVIGLRDAHSVELDPSTTHPVIHLMPEQDGVEDIGGTLRLGSYPCVLDRSSMAYGLYQEETIHERHRYEVNNDYRGLLTKNGMKLSGLSPDGRIVEMVEIPSHPWFIATQAHPELKSRPNRPHPLFRGFIEAALNA